MAMCCGLVVNECGGCIKTAPLKFTFVIHLFVPNGEENQVCLGTAMSLWLGAACCVPASCARTSFCMFKCTFLQREMQDVLPENEQS